MKDYEELLRFKKVLEGKTLWARYNYGSYSGWCSESFEMISADETVQKLMAVNDILQKEIDDIKLNRNNPYELNQKKPWYKFW